MKKFNKSTIAGYALLILFSIISLSVIIINLKEIYTEAADKRYLSATYKSTFEENSILFVPHSNNAETPQISHTITAIYGDELKGIAPLNNSVTLGGIPSIRITESYLFSADYLTLIEGRMPNPYKSAEDTVEILLATLIYSSSTQPLKIGSILKTDFRSAQTNDIITVNMQIVGKVDTANEYPYPDSLYSNVSLIVPDFGEQIGIELLPDRYEALYLTFSNKVDAASVRQQLQHIGNVLPLPQNAEILQSNYELSKKVQITETVSAIAVFLMLAVAFIILSFLICSKQSGKAALKQHPAKP